MILFTFPFMRLAEGPVSAARQMLAAGRRRTPKPSGNIQPEDRTKCVILNIYDATAEAKHAGIPYQTRLDPPPANLRLAHELRQVSEP